MIQKKNKIKKRTKQTKKKSFIIQRIKMDKIENLRQKGYTYLIHDTSHSNMIFLYEQFLENPLQKINTYYERYLHQIQVDGIYSYQDIDFLSPFVIDSSGYPGLFLHLSHLTIEEIENKYKNKEDEIGIVFPLELLLQKNWHFNINDKNGYIYYDTYFSDNINNIPSYQEILNYYEGEYIGNEIVFHDGIYLSNNIGIFGKTNIQIPHKLRFEMDKKPNYIYYSDRKYSGIYRKYFHHEYQNEITTSDSYYIKMIHQYLPDEYKYLCNGVKSKKELEIRIYHTKVEDMDLFTYLHIFRP